VAVVNEALARKYFADRDPLGHSVDGRRIVGLVGDTRQDALRAAAPPLMFIPCGQSTTPCQRLVVKGGLRPVLLGVALGSVAALLLGRLVVAALYGVPSHDPATLVGASLLLVGVALLASWVPARRASRLDAAAALRCE
jgi:hypothetical protein